VPGYERIDEGGSIVECKIRMKESRKAGAWNSVGDERWGGLDRKGGGLRE